MSKFIMLGNEFFPVNTRSQCVQAGWELNKSNPATAATAEVWEGIPGLSADKTGELLDCDGDIFRLPTRYLAEENWLRIRAARRARTTALLTKTV